MPRRPVSRRSAPGARGPLGQVGEVRRRVGERVRLRGPPRRSSTTAYAPLTPVAAYSRRPTSTRPASTTQAAAVRERGLRDAGDDLAAQALPVERALAGDHEVGARPPARRGRRPRAPSRCPARGRRRGAAARSPARRPRRHPARRPGPCRRASADAAAKCSSDALELHDRAVVGALLRPEAVASRRAGRAAGCRRRRRATSSTPATRGSRAARGRPTATPRSAAPPRRAARSTSLPSASSRWRRARRASRRRRRWSPSRRARRRRGRARRRPPPRRSSPTPYVVVAPGIARSTGTRCRPQACARLDVRRAARPRSTDRAAPARRADR